MTLGRATAPHDRLGLFTCADVVGQSQLHAWGSWKDMPDCAVSVFGNAPGVGDHAKRFGFRSIPTVKRDEFGRPLLNWIFERIHDDSTESVLGYVNSDIILLPGLAASIAAVRARFDTFLMVARRWNVESLPAIDFGPGWDEQLRTVVTREGELFTPYGIDLFVFSRGLLQAIPPFALGGDYWDNYLVMQTRRRGYPVIDITQQVMLVHQNHSLGKYRSAAERRRSPEGLRGFALVGDSHANLGRTTDATHVMAHGEISRAETASVTVVLPHRGETRRLCYCLRSLEHQTYPQSFLHAIVVNNDPDAPLRYLEADFPGVRVVTEASAGLAAARNKGISCAGAEVVALFDSDIIAAPECVERAMRVMKDHPDCQIVACRIDPLFVAGPVGYLTRAVEWFDAVTHYNPNDWLTPAGACIMGALMVRKEVFASCGYFNDVCPDPASANGEWIRRVIAAGVTVAFCHDGVVRHATVKRFAELRRKQQTHARGDCILKSLESGDAYSVQDLFRDEWREWRGRVWNAWTNKRIPPHVRAGVLLISLWSVVWAVSAKLQYRHDAPRVLRRRRHAMARMVQPRAKVDMRRAGFPFRGFGLRGQAHAVPTPREPGARAGEPATRRPRQ